MRLYGTKLGLQFLVLATEIRQYSSMYFIFFIFGQLHSLTIVLVTTMIKNDIVVTRLLALSYVIVYQLIL